MKRHIKSVLVCLLLGAIVNVAVAWGLALRPDPAVRPLDWLGFGVTAKESHFRYTTYKDYIDRPGDALELMPSALGTAPQRSFTRWTGETVAIWGQHKEILPYDHGIRPARSGLLRVLFAADSAEQFNAMLPSWSKLHDPSDFVQDAALVRYVERATGWPFLSLSMAQMDHFTVGANPNAATPAPAKHIVTRKGAVEVPSAVLPTPRRPIMQRNDVPLQPLWPGFLANTSIYSALFWIMLVELFALRRTIRRRRGQCANCKYDLRGDAHARCPECGAATTALPTASRTMRRQTAERPGGR